MVSPWTNCKNTTVAEVFEPFIRWVRTSPLTVETQWGVSNTTNVVVYFYTNILEGVSEVTRSTKKKKKTVPLPTEEPGICLLKKSIPESESGWISVPLIEFS